jgi:hypothetical protein
MTGGAAGTGAGRPGGRTDPGTAGPSSGNTRVHRTRADGDGLQAGVHWADFTVRGDDHDRVLEAAGAALGAFYESKRGTSRYRRKWDGPHGATVEAGFRLSSRDHVRVSLPGEACEVLGLEVVRDLVAALGGKVTRVDAAVDGVCFTPVQLERAWRHGHIRSHIPREDPEACTLYRNGAGATLYLGSPRSDRRLRCYDRRGPVRVEMQLRRAAAAGWWRAVCAATLDEFGELVRGLVAGFVEVARPVGEDSNRSRWTRLPWWDRFLEGAPALVGLVKRTPSSLVGLVAHVRRQAAAVATYVDAVAALGHPEEDTIRDLLWSGRARRSSRHAAMLAGVAWAM